MKYTTFNAEPTEPAENGLLCDLSVFSVECRLRAFHGLQAVVKA